MFTATTKVEATFSDEELRKLSSFNVQYPGQGDTLTAGKQYTATWKAGERVRSSVYTVRLADAAYQYDEIVGTAYENQGSFTFTVPASLNGSYFLVFASNPPGLGGNSNYFTIESQKALTAPLTDLVVTYNVGADFPGDSTSINVEVGGWANYAWSISKADSYTLTESLSDCSDTSSNRTNARLKIEKAEGSSSDKINSYLAGCTITRTIQAISGAVTKSATTVVNVK